MAENKIVKNQYSLEGYRNVFDVENLQGIDIRRNDWDEPVLNSNASYINKDYNWEFMPFLDDYIYICGSDGSYNQIKDVLEYQKDPEKNEFAQMPTKGYPALSGCFTNEKTVADTLMGEDGFDSKKLMGRLQQAPYFDQSEFEAAAKRGEEYYPQYHNRLICLKINKEKLKNYEKMNVFFAAQGVCTENSDWGDGGGMQGYNPFINELINDGILELVPEKSRHNTGEQFYMDYYIRKENVAEKIEEAGKNPDWLKIAGNNTTVGYNEIMSGKIISPIAQTDSKTAFIKTVKSASITEYAIFGGLLAGLITTFFICGNGGFLSTLCWFAAVTSAFLILLGVCLKTNGLPKFLRSKVGGFILVALFALWFGIVPLIVKFLVFVFTLAIAFFVFKVISLFGPDGTITVTRVDADGRSSQETIAVYGDMNTEMSRVENQLRSEGYTDIRKS